METHYMSVLLCIFSYPGANETVKRHWPFFQNQQADWVYGIGTTDGKCRWPEGMSSLDIGDDRYIEGGHLPNRMLDTIETMLLMPWNHLILTEYDTVFFRGIPAEEVKTAACFHAGGPTWGSKAQWFGHNPWVLARDSAIEFLRVGRQAIKDDVCPDRGRGQPSTPECSPDVFWAYVCDKAHIPVQFDLWKQYSKNDFSNVRHLDQAKEAYGWGYHVIHGIKTKEQLDFIMS